MSKGEFFSLSGIQKELVQPSIRGRTSGSWRKVSAKLLAQLGRGGLPSETLEGRSSEGGRSVGLVPKELL